MKEEYLDTRTLTEIAQKMGKIGIVELMNLPFIENTDLKEKIAKFNDIKSKKSREKVSKMYGELIKECNEYLFSIIPVKYLNDFEAFVLEGNSKDYQGFVKLKRQYDKFLISSDIIPRGSLFEEEFSNSPSVLQKKVISNVPYKYYFEMIKIASDEVQEEILRDRLTNNHIDGFDLSALSKQAILKNKEALLGGLRNVIGDILNNLSCDIEKLDELDELDVTFLKRALTKISEYNAVLPEELKEEYYDIFFGTKIKILNALCKGLSEEETIESDIDLNSIHFEDIAKLSDINKIEWNVVINNCKNLSLFVIETLKKIGMNIKTVQMQGEYLGHRQKQKYEINQYIACRKIITDILADGVPTHGGTQKEKSVIIAERIAHLIEYNYDYSNKLENSIETTEEEDFENAGLLGLLKGKCVCSGFAEIYRNVLECAGIRALYMDCENIDPKKFGHAYNLVCADGDWYNSDICWSRRGLLDRNMMPAYLLKSDEDFKHDGHEKYIPRTRIGLPRCEKSIPNIDVKLYKKISYEHYHNFIKDLLKKALSPYKPDEYIDMREVEEAAKMIQATIKDNNEYGSI